MFLHHQSGALHEVVEQIIWPRRFHDTWAWLFLWHLIGRRQNNFALGGLRRGFELPVHRLRCERAGLRLSFIHSSPERSILFLRRDRFFGIKRRRVQFFDVVGLQPPGLRVVLTQDIPSLALATTVVTRHPARNIEGTAITSPASVFKHQKHEPC